MFLLIMTLIKHWGQQHPHLGTASTCLQNQTSGEGVFEGGAGLGGLMLPEVGRCPLPLPFPFLRCPGAAKDQPPVFPHQLHAQFCSPQTCLQCLPLMLHFRVHPCSHCLTSPMGHVLVQSLHQDFERHWCRPWMCRAQGSHWVQAHYKPVRESLHSCLMPQLCTGCTALLL